MDDFFPFLTYKRGGDNKFQGRIEIDNIGGVKIGKFSTQIVTFPLGEGFLN